VLGYEYHEAAEAEYLEAVNYYSTIEPDLGSAFVAELEAAIERARQFPAAYGKITANLRHVRTHRFPYAIIYEVLEDRIFIWAVAHGSREPGYWEGRL